MSANAALTANAEAAEAQAYAAPPPPPPAGDTHATAAAGGEPNRPARRPRVLTLEQESLVRTFQRSYGIEPEQIYFYDETLDPDFALEAMSILTLVLAPHIQDIRIEIASLDQARGLALSRGVVVLADGRTRSGDAGCAVGEMLPSGEIVETLKSASDLSGARSLKKALRMVGFDAVRAHEARERGDEAPPARLTPEEEQRERENKEIHALAEECGYIVGKDKTRYRQQIGLWFEGKDSSLQLTAAERAKLIAYLRGIKSARERA